MDLVPPTHWLRGLNVASVNQVWAIFSVHMFFSHHQTQVLGNKNGGKKSLAMHVMRLQHSKKNYTNLTFST